MQAFSYIKSMFYIETNIFIEESEFFNLIFIIYNTCTW